MPKKNISAAQRAASVRNLAAARAARARRGATPQGKLDRGEPRRALKTTKVVLFQGQLHRATRNFMGTTVIHHPALTGTQLKRLHKRK